MDQLGISNTSNMKIGLLAMHRQQALEAEIEAQQMSKDIRLKEKSEQKKKKKAEKVKVKMNMEMGYFKAVKGEFNIKESLTTSMGYETIFEYLGSYGPFQKRIHFLASLPAIMTAFHRLIGVFILAEPSFRCNLPDEDENYENTTLSFINTTYTCTRPGDEPNSTVACDQWVYDNSTYENSLVTEFDLVCDEAWLVPTGQSMVMLGDLLGSVVFGILSDRYGRKPTFFVSLVLQLVFGLVLAFLHNVIAFMVVRVAIGMATAGVFTTAYVIGVELVGPDKRLFAGVLIEFFWSVGYGILALAAYFIRDWRTLQISVTVPGALFLCYWWFIPESARWLMSEGRMEETKAVIEKAAKVNKVHIPDDVLASALKSVENEQQVGFSVRDLLKCPRMTIRALLVFFNWYAACCSFYGISLSTSSLGGNDHLNFFLVGVVELPAYAMLLLTLNKMGRVPILCASVLLGGLAHLSELLVPAGMTWLTVTLAMIGKFAVTMGFVVDFIITMEMFPTVIRNIAVGMGATCARFGSLVSPYIFLLAAYWHPLPQVIFGVQLLLAAIMTFGLPETLHKELPDTIEQGEKFGLE
ncbi:organic cation transporter protein [Anabrus simplex]|uniref:organic cation transporter protein n=1 Tax=Anabrus simplex TaxID=316456 RepID=UPI0035A33983